MYAGPEVPGIMPIKTTEESTGIYRTVSKRFNSEHPTGVRAKSREAKELREVFSSMAESDIHAQLDDLEKRTKAILKEHGVFPGIRRSEDSELTGVPDEFLGLARRGGEWFPLPAGAVPIAKRARNLIFDIWNVRAELRKAEARNPESISDMRHLALSAYKLGRLAEMVRVSPFEAAVITGAPVKRGQRSGGNMRAEKYRPFYEPMKMRLKQIMKSNPHLRYTGASKRVAEKFHCSPKHVRNHVPNPRSK